MAESCSVGPVLSHELCAIFVCIFNLYITVFMLQLYPSENYGNLPSHGTYLR